MAVNRQGIRLSLCALVVLALGACTASDPAETPSTETKSDAPSSATPSAGQQSQSCEWDKPQITADPKADAPQGTSGDLKKIVVGSWQQTHFDFGDGFKPVKDKDLRYVFPSSSRLLFCKDAVGTTNRVDNAADIVWDGNLIAPPAGKGFEIVSWNNEAMIWVNKFDNARYLLKRR